MRGCYYKMTGTVNATGSTGRVSGRFMVISPSLVKKNKKYQANLKENGGPPLPSRVWGEATLGSYDDDGRSECFLKPECRKELKKKEGKKISPAIFTQPRWL